MGEPTCDGRTDVTANARLGGHLRRSAQEMFSVEREHMSPTSPFEIHMRKMTEQSLEQVRTAISGYLQFFQRAVPGNVMGGSELSNKVFGYAERNLASAFEFAQRLVQVTDVQGLARLQTDFIQAQMQAITEQATDLHETAAKAVMDSLKTSTPNAPQATVTLKHFAAVLAERHEMTKKQSEEILSHAVGLVTNHLKKGDRIRIAGLGILQVRERAVRMGRNPATGEQIKIKASKKVVFRASNDLNTALGM
jgi:DNA-binding protein HU-beta